MSDETPKPSSEKPAAYRVLARKYRPKDFSDLMVGQEPMVRTLTNAFETGRIAQAYMLTGVRGVGKLNKKVLSGEIVDLINLSEALLSWFTIHVEMTTDWDLARTLGVPPKIVTVAQNLSKKQSSD